MRPKLSLANRPFRPIKSIQAKKRFYALIKCDTCGEYKYRRKFRVKNAREEFSVYKTKQGYVWDGNTCPKCSSEVEKGVVVTLYRTHRTCRVCKCVLMSDRYFNCRQCRPGIDDDEKEGMV